MTRSSGSRDRALSNTVGFILVFSFLVITFTLYQGIVIPEQNRQVEFDHNERVQSQIQDLRNAIVNAAGGTDRSTTVKLGADYPQRTIAQNLASSSGHLGTVDPGGGIEIRNVTALDSETRDYFGDGSTTLGAFETKSVRYDPSYARYTNAPTTVYENTVAYNRFEAGENITLTDQRLVDGRRITLVAVNGSLSESSTDAVTVDAEALSTSTERVAVTNASGRLNVTIPTRLPAANWSDLLADQMDAPGDDEKYVVAVRDTGANQVSILFEAGVTYDLRLAKVGVGADTDPEEPHYVTGVAGNGTSVAEGGSRKLVVEVRDRFNNPVSNVTVESAVTGSAGTGDTVTPATAETDARGRAAFTYNPPSNVDGPQHAEVRLHFNSTTVARENATFDLTVLDSDGSGACGSGGTGGNASWCSGSNGTVSQPGGVISGIGGATKITLADPSFTSVTPKQGDVKKSDEWFRLAFAIEKDQDDLTGTTRYLFVVPDQQSGFRQELDNSSIRIQNRKVIVYKDASVNGDDTGYTKFVQTKMKASDLESWYRGQLVIDLLDASHYEGSVSTELAEIRDFLQNNEVRIYIVDMDGRVEFGVE